MNLLEATIEPDIIYQFSSVICSYQMEHLLPERAVARTLYIDGEVVVQNEGLSSEPLIYKLDGSNDWVGKQLEFRIQSEEDDIDFTVAKIIQNGRAILEDIRIDPDPVYQYSKVVCSYTLGNVIFGEKVAVRTLYLDGVVVAQDTGLSTEPLTYFLDGSDEYIGQELAFTVIIEDDDINNATSKVIEDGSAYVKTISIGDESQYTTGQVHGDYLLTDSLFVAYIPETKIKALGVSESEYTGYIDESTEVVSVPLTGLTTLIVHHGYDNLNLEDVILGLEFLYEDESRLSYGQTSSSIGQQEVIVTQRLISMAVWAVSITVQRVEFTYQEAV
ncbi:TPA: hypothetical protein ACGTRQ_003811 [Vibrio parahaemolyticus]